MPLCLLRHHQLNLAAWDACVAEAQAVVPYAQSWWLQATAGCWDAVVEVLADGRYASVLPLPVRRRPWGREVVQPLFTQQLGLLTTVGSRHVALPDYLGLVRAAGYARFYTQLHDAAPVAAAPAGFQLATRLTYHLPLPQSYEQLLAAYAPDYRRRLRLNARLARPLAVTATTTAEPLLALFQQTKGAAAGLRPRHYAGLRRLVAALQARQAAELLEVREPETGVLLAGALFVRYRTRLVYLFAAASAAGKQANAPILLLDQAIRHHAGTPGLILDFEGGMIPAIARFFANFGAEPVPYAALSFTQPWYLKWMR